MFCSVYVGGIYKVLSWRAVPREDLINCGQALAVCAHRDHYTYLYSRNMWLKPLVSDAVWAIRNGVRKLHYIVQIDHFDDKARIHVTQ